MSTTTAPKTREEDFHASIFEWVKADREGDVCKFKEFIIENGEEYTVFNDNSRIKSMLLGDVVLKHQHESQLLGKEIAPLQRTLTVEEPFEFPIDSDLVKNAKSVPKKINYVNDAADYSAPISTPSRATVVSPNSAIQNILDKSKKKKQKVTIEFIIEAPSSEVLTIIRDNFNGSDDELYNFFIAKIDKKKFLSAIISAVQNK